MSSQAQQQLISSLLNDLKNYSVNNKSFIPSELKSSDKKHKKSSSQHSQYAPSVDSLHSSETTTQPTLEYTPSPSAMQIVDNFVRLHPLTVSPSAQGTLLQHGVTDKLMSELIKIFTERINFIKHSSLNNFNIGHLIFANYLHLLLPCFEPCKFIAADFWNIFLKPVLFKCRWKNLVDLCSEIVLEMMTGEHFASLILRSIHIHADLLQSSGAMGTSTVAVLEFRNTVVLSYLKERIAVWDEIKLETDEKDVPSSSPGWETIAESNLEQVLNDFGMLCPKDFFALFAEFCIKPEYRLQTLLLLCRFVKREESQAFFVIETALFNLLVKCLMVDTHPAIVCTSLTILVLLMPHCCTRLGEGDLLERMLNSFLRSIFWSMDYDSIISRIERQKYGFLSHAEDYPDPNTIKSVDSLLAVYSKIASTESVEYFFAYLYGMFPCATIRFLRAFINSDGLDFFTSKVNEHILNTKSDEAETFPVANDPFEVYRVKVENTDEQKKFASQRILNLLENHKVHQNLVLLDPERERTCQHFKGREPYELAMECLSQRVGYDELDQVRLDVSTRSLTFSPHFRSKAKLSGASVRASSPNSVSQTREPANELTITLNSSVKLDEIPNGAAFPIVRHEVAHGNLMDGLNEETSTEFRRSVHVSSSPESIPPLDLKDAYTERKYANESIHDSLDAILEINRSLRRSFAEARHNAHHPATPTSSKSIRFPTAIHFGKHHDKHPRSTASSSHTDLIAPFLFENTLKLHLFMLMNELNFETALRNNYMQQIRKLRKEKLLNEGNDSTVAAQTAITKHFDAEIKRYTQLVEQQDQEIKSVRERCLKFEQELAIEKITKQSLQEELATLQLKLSEEEKSCEVLKKDMAERDELIAELKLKHDGIMTDFSYLKECELNLNFLTNVLLEREAEKRQLELQAQENENMNSRLKVAHERNYIIQQLESQLRNEIDQQAALLSHANAKLIQHEQLLEVQKRTIQDQATTMENLRLKNIEHISAVKAKYDTIKQINIQLERRIGDLLEKIEGQQSSDSSSNHEFPEDSYSLTPVRIGHYDFI